ncbi:retrotransposon protein [Cucumis melo var. makuwa]|uniref:Retrotransposon protein n=1 Tax=Cucumis melo var. makuwa TaxID=1194695 RepID=A0A5D3CAM8_CUCMM|nr:retrotransposon protein [Cucumis melo var. makuwa]TYK08352.1 retrotransposon protein [Cucumis melo var. makuwa]
MLELLKNDTKRITHIPHETRHRIRQLAYLRMIHGSYLVCRQSTRMDRRCFTILCHLLRTIVGLTLTEVIDVEEMVAMFLHILVHDNCLGALDGTYIKVNVSASDHARYRVCKEEVATNVLDVCDTKGDFVYVLASYYYLVDAGYPNAEGFLAPYRGQCYHLQEWRGPENAPSTSKEFFNMKHSSACNVIERAFGVLKGRWAILWGKSYYPVEVQCHTILACCLLHNLINREMTNFDIEDNIDEVDSTHATTAADDIHYIEKSNEWSQWRDDLAEEMFTDWELRNQ